MKADVFRIASVIVVVALAWFTFDLVQRNVFADRLERQAIKAKQNEIAAQIEAERQRVLAFQREMADTKPQRSKKDCERSLEKIQKTRSKLGLAKTDHGGFYLVCNNHLITLDGDTRAYPTSSPLPSNHPCDAVEIRTYSLAGCPLELIQKLPAHF